MSRGWPLARSGTPEKRSSDGLFVDLVFFPEQAQGLALLALLVRIGARSWKIMVGDGVYGAADQECDPPLRFDQLVRQRTLIQVHARSGECPDRTARGELRGPLDP